MSVLALNATQMFCLLLFSNTGGEIKDVLVSEFSSQSHSPLRLNIFFHIHTIQFSSG